MSGGEALVKALVGEGVEVVFGIPGIHMYGIIAAMRDEPNIRMISTRHEQATTYMADGYSRVSGKPGVALVVPGVGMYNAASGLATAYARSSPVLMIAGQIPRGQIGGTDLHNPDFVKFAESFGAVGMRADQPMDLAELIPLALERKAPVVIDVPFGDMPIPRAPQIAPLYALPWTMPQKGRIDS